MIVFSQITVPLTCLLVAVEIPPAVPITDEEPSQTTDSTVEYVASGIKVIHRIRNDADLVTVRLYLLGGSRQLTEGNAGIEALMMRASELEWSRPMVATGSHTMLEATSDWTVAGFVALPRELDSAWNAFEKRFTQMGLSQESINRARGELLTNARRRYTQPDLRIFAVLQSGAFSEHPYSIDPSGTEKSLASLDEVDFENYWEQHYVTSRMLLVVVGPVAPDRIETLISNTLGSLPRGDYEWRLPPPIPEQEPRWMIEQRDLSTNYILGLFGGPPPTHEDYFPFRVSLALLSSQLMAEVRGQGSLSYSAYAPFLDGCMPIGGIYASSPKPDETMAVIRYVLRNVMRLRVSGKQWRSFLEQFAVEDMLMQMTSEGQADALARAYLYFGNTAIADEMVDRMRDVKVEEIREVVERYVSKMQYGFLGDTLKMGDQW